MAISGGMGVLQTGLQNIQRTAETAPMPLDALEAKRARDQAEKLAAYEAQTNRLKAEAAGTTARATSAQEARKAKALTDEVAEIRRIKAENPMTKKPGEPGYLQEKYNIYTQATLSENPDVRDWAHDMMGTFDKELKTSTGGAMVGERGLEAGALESAANATEAMVQADVARSGQQLQQAYATEPDRVWAKGIIAGMNPTTLGFGGWDTNAQAAYKEELADILRDLRLRYMDDPNMTPTRLKDMAKAEFLATKGLQGGATQQHPPFMGNRGGQLPAGSLPPQPLPQQGQPQGAPPQAPNATGMTTLPDGRQMPFFTVRD